MSTSEDGIEMNEAPARNEAENGHEEESVISDNENDNEQQPDNDTATQTKPHCTTSHFRNKEEHSVWCRYGIPLYLLATLGLLLASDIGSGVAAEYILIQPDGSVFEQETLLEASIFSSVSELWNTQSYALAILIVITSIMWPYVKLSLSLFSWMAPYRNARRRERLLEITDALAKWSFLDIFVLILIAVAFRATIELNAGVSMEVVIVPRWGFYGFVLATMLSLVGTHVILYLHRRLIYKDDNETTSAAEQDEEGAQQEPTTPEKQSLTTITSTKRWLVVTLLVITLGLIIAGCVLYIFEVSNRQGENVQSTLYSVLSVGSGVPSASLEPNSVGIRWIQAMYYLLGFVLPMLNVVLFGTLYLCPMTAKRHRQGFMAAEICFSWSSIEVLLISCIFSVIQIPKFGNGLINSGCTYCFTVDSSLLPELSVLAIASVMSVAVNIWLYRKAHAVLYPSPS